MNDVLYQYASIWRITESFIKGPFIVRIFFLKNLYYYKITIDIKWNP